MQGNTKRLVEVPRNHGRLVTTCRAGRTGHPLDGCPNTRSARRGIVVAFGNISVALDGSVRYSEGGLALGRPIVIALFMPLVSIISGARACATVSVVSIEERFSLLVS